MLVCPPLVGKPPTCLLLRKSKRPFSDCGDFTTTDGRTQQLQLCNKHGGVSIMICHLLSALHRIMSSPCTSQHTHPIRTQAPATIQSHVAFPSACTKQPMQALQSSSCQTDSVQGDAQSGHLADRISRSKHTAPFSGADGPPSCSPARTGACQACACHTACAAPLPGSKSSQT